MYTKQKYTCPESGSNSSDSENLDMEDNQKSKKYTGTFGINDLKLLDLFKQKIKKPGNMLSLFL